METKVETFMGGDPGWIRTSDLQLRSLVAANSLSFPEFPGLIIIGL
jgi:hypothetical protein